jgi:hypothetical protein
MRVIGIVLFSWRIEVAHEAVAARNLQSDVGVIGVTHHNVRYRSRGWSLGLGFNPSMDVLCRTATP